MTGTIVSRCRSCQAVVNVNWQSCVACRKPINNGIAPGCLLYWRGMDGQTRGPALLRGTFEDEGHVWAWFVLAGTEYLIRADLIVKVQRAGEP